MIIEKNFYNVNLTEMTVLVIFGLGVINGIVFLFSMLTGVKFVAVFSNTWPISIGYPLVHGVIQSLLNRNGVMSIRKFDDPESLREQIEHSARRIGYIITEKGNGHLKFNRRTKAGRGLNLLFREDFRVTFSDSEVKVFGKRNPLNRIEKRLTYLK